MATPEAIKQIVKELNPQAIFLKGFEKAIIGTGKTIGGQTVAIYNADDCLNILIDEHSMDEIEAWEHFNRTVAEGSPSPNKPIFISDWRWAKDIDQVIKDIKLDKQQTIDDILKQIQDKDEDSETDEEETDEEENE